MELTRTNAVFSRIAMVLFLWRNVSSRNVLKIYGEFFWKIWKIPAQRSTRGDGPVGHKPCFRAPWPRQPSLWGPRGSAAPKLSSINSLSPRKKSEEKITSHWRTGASHISLRVITVAWWISSKQITDPLPTSFVLLLLLLVLLCCYCCYYCRLLLLLLATVVTTAFPCRCYCSLHCCYLLQFWFAGRWRELTISVNEATWRHWYNR